MGHCISLCYLYFTWFDSPLTVMLIYGTLIAWMKFRIEKTKGQLKQQLI